MNDLNLSMFRAYDIRTTAERLTDELAVRLARAEAVYFRETLGARGILVAHDARSTGPHYLELATEQFRRAGLTVAVVPGVCSTSEFYFAAMTHPDLAAVLYGASHNPANDTGQKILGPGVRPIAEHIGPEGGLDKIKALYKEGVALPPATAPVHAYDPTAEYVAFSMKLAGIEPGGLEGLEVLHDYLNGAAGREMMLAFGQAGAALTPLHFAADGRFPLGDPNPVKSAVICEGIEALKAGKFVLGSFFDGDGDRIDFYRGDGQYLSSSFVYAAILPEIRKRMAGSDLGVFACLKSNPLAIMEMAKSGVSVEIIRSGHSQIKNALFENPKMFGTVEESAHFYESFLYGGGRYCTENTLYIALLMARVWKQHPERFDALFAIQSRTAREREWGYLFPSDDKRAAALDAVRGYFETQGARAIDRMPNGYDLEATMMRRGLPFAVQADTALAPDWLQVCQRISQSEDGLARWEVVAVNADIAADAKAAIGKIAAEHGAGEEYQG